MKEKRIPTREAKDLYTPLPLLKYKVLNTFVSRDTALKQAETLLRKDGISETDFSYLDYRWRFPVVTIRGGPGSGKACQT
jgi:hypothetical protein